FFVEGGALAVENALKVAFDWKSRQNEAAGRDRGLGTRILHLSRAFHGRSGYTLSLTNTEPNKTDRFPMFDWPRIDVPAMIFPLADHLDEVLAAEQRALSQARAAFDAHPHDIAAFIAEPIQGEGGDNHLRPEFLRAMLELAHAHDALFILDEVQTGVGTTGTPWAYQQLGVQPDVVAFAKKAQLGGIMAGGRVDEVPDNVFAVSGRINSTWGGGLTDMVRCRRLLEVIESAGLIEAAGPKGALLVAKLESIASETGRLDNVRGRGLFVACDLPDTRQRDRMVADLRRKERVIVLPCGERSIRFRPALSVSEDEIDEAVQAVGRSARRLTEVKE
ncbi:MAG TPA: L-lysine 6-transaminase, partial [Propionibacteriaceae bacterium]|nr:L-lysine 6-transaminase [Propionibacteriaceae bacterium]